MQKTEQYDCESAQADPETLTAEAAEIAAFHWNVDYLKDCEQATRDLRDKARFLGLNQLADMLEGARTESQTVLTTLMLANGASDRATQ